MAFDQRNSMETIARHLRQSNHLRASNVFGILNSALQPKLARLATTLVRHVAANEGSTVPHLYAVQFDIDPGQAGADATANQIQEEVRSWVVERYRAKWHAECTYPEAGQTEQPLPGHSIARQTIDVDNASLTRIRWIHPHDLDSSVQWSTDVAIARHVERLQFAVQVGVASTSFVVRPAPIYLGRPRIVSDILRHHSCWIGSTPLVTQKQQIVAADVSTFVESQLLAPLRLVPIIVVSSDRFTDRPVIDADRMQQTLHGFAQVAVLDKWASFQLTEEIGRQLSCFNGCVRVYWPGLTRKSEARRHWLYFPAQLERFQYLGKPLDRRLFSFLAQLSVFRFTDGDVHKAVQLAIDSRRQVEAARIHQQIEAGRAAANDARDLKDLLDLAAEENFSLNQQLAQLKDENSDLQSRLRDVQANFSLMQQQMALESEGESADSESDPELETVSDALARAERDLADGLLLLDSARRSAARSDFPRPDEVYKALLAINDVGRLYFNSLQAASSMGGWDEQLSARGLTQYSPNESETVKNDYKNYGKHREFTVDGKKRKIYQHLDLGGGDRKACLQIYFEADRSLGKVIIAHCGRHLPIPSNRT